MAFFGVTIEEISEVGVHPNADRLSLARVKGMSFQFVIQKDQFSVGDKVLYFPIDSLLTLPILEKLNLVGKLSGKDKNRVKTIRLRDEISQGLVSKVDLFLTESQRELSSEEITSLLGVTKYEPPILFVANGILTSLPEGLSPYDIEGADRYQNVVDMMKEEEVVVLEKLEGMNYSCGKVNGEFVVNQRNHSIKEKEGEEHSFWKIDRKYRLMDSLKDERDFVLYGEFCGPSSQGNIYNLKDVELFVFDIKKNGKWLEWTEVVEWCSKNGLKITPELFRGKLSHYLNEETIQSKSNGKSNINSNIHREGIVVKPLKEQRIDKLGRMIIKQRSPVYLAGSDN